MLINVARAAGRSLHFGGPCGAHYTADEEALRHFKDMLTDRDEDPLLVDDLMDELRAINAAWCRCPTNADRPELTAMTDAIRTLITTGRGLIEGGTDDPVVFHAAQAFFDECLLGIFRYSWDERDRAIPGLETPLTQFATILHDSPVNWQTVQHYADVLLEQLQVEFVPREYVWAGESRDEQELAAMYSAVTDLPSAAILLDYLQEKFGIDVDSGSARFLNDITLKIDRAGYRHLSTWRHQFAHNWPSGPIWSLIGLRDAGLGHLTCF
jgi:hypothetical protein